MAYIEASANQEDSLAREENSSSPLPSQTQATTGDLGEQTTDLDEMKTTDMKATEHHSYQAWSEYYSPARRPPNAAALERNTAAAEFSPTEDDAAFDFCDFDQPLGQHSPDDRDAIGVVVDSSDSDNDSDEKFEWYPSAHESWMEPVASSLTPRKSST